MDASREVVEKSIKSVEDAVELFYQQKNKEGMEKFNGALGDMAEAVDVLFSYNASHDGFGLDEIRLAGILKDAMGAMEKADKVLMADILQYDYVEYVKELLEKME